MTDLRDAGSLSQIVGKNDLVVGGWDPMTTLYGSIWVDDRVAAQRNRDAERFKSLWADNDHFFSFTTQAVTSGPDVMPHLRDAISEYREGTGGNVYFLGLLDMSQSDWDAFFCYLRCGFVASILR